MHLGWNGIWENWFGGFGALAFAIFIIWILAWKGIALWTAARNKHKIWFIALLLINTAGILEILYIYILSKQKWAR